jgi:hypothetical protein
LGLHKRLTVAQKKALNARLRAALTKAQLFRRQHGIHLHLSAVGHAHLVAALRAAAAERRKKGIKIHHRYHHRKSHPLSAATRAKIAAADRRAAARRGQAVPTKPIGSGGRVPTQPIGG